MYGQPIYYPNPAMQSAQQRLQMMEAQYPQYSGSPGIGYTQPAGYQSPAQQTQSAAPILKGRPVSNEEEANAAMIDFDGSLFVFPDKAHGKIYTKQLGLDGNIVFNRYSLDMPNQPASQTPPVSNPPQDLSEYVKKTDLESRFNGFMEKLNALEQRVQKSFDSTPLPKGGNSK